MLQVYNYIIFMLGNKFEKKVFNVDLKVLIVSFVDWYAVP